MRRRLLFCCIAAAAQMLAGCALFTSKNNDSPEQTLATTEHNAISLLNYRTAREYSASGRFELAKEHYLLAYAAAGENAALRESLRQELHSVDLMIKTMR